MKKYIHYCWFGGKPLPKLARKCIKSWKKYLPDYEIIEWNESNVDLKECKFVEEAYENKKWAFVSDYVRTKVLKEYGGIYFDTDMEIVHNIDHLFNSDTFLGVEDSGFVAVGVWYEKNKEAFLPTELLNTYQKMTGFDAENIKNISIPILLSKKLETLGVKYGSKKIQKLNKGIVIYPRDYFYPYSYNRENNIFTENTCMIHYYDASWIPLKDRIENNMVRKLGLKKTYDILQFYRKTKHYLKQILKCVLFPLVIYRNKKRQALRITKEYIDRTNETVLAINKLEKTKKQYVVFHNKLWLGVTSATIELFENTVDCGELYRKEEVKKIGDAIVNSSIKSVVFSSFAFGYKDLAIYLKKKKQSIKIKSYWHGSHSQVLDGYGWQRNQEIINLHKKGIIDVMGSCKQSLINFYNKQGYNAHFITNKVTTNVLPNRKVERDEVKIGLYAAKCDDWRKNMYTQIAAASLIENAVIDMVPLNDSAKEFAEMLGVKLEGSQTPLTRDRLIKRMSDNDVNLYVTFSECAPMLPLESLEMNVPCITGNNHHYFKNQRLEEYLVINNEENPIEIKNKITECIKNKADILKYYKKFREDNLKDSKEALEKFLEI